MCGRYALALRPSQVRQMLEDGGMPVYDSPDDDSNDSPRQSYNFAPGYHGVVYRADTSDQGAGPQRSNKADAGSEADTDATGHTPTSRDATQYKLQTMKWGLIPFWTKRNPDYSSMMKTINCRDDSLSTPGGMWSTMKARKRCIVVAQGFFEWLKTGPKDKLPHYVKRKDGQLMCFAGLWDCVQYENDADNKHYTYTIITTDSNKQLKFLHDRMPVILEPGSDAAKTWLDPGRYEWSRELQSLLKPFDGELDVYPVSKDVGKVGNNSATFVRPLDSKDNKSNIINLFKSQATAKQPTSGGRLDEAPVKTECDVDGTPLQEGISAGSKRKRSAGHEELKAPKRNGADLGTSFQHISPTKNNSKSPNKQRGKTETGSQKITSFFKK